MTSASGKANIFIVNELSGTIDLQSTLTRAEALFRRFQRTVEAVDRKDNFPTPSNVRQRKPQLPVPGPSNAGASTGNNARGQAVAASPTTEREKVISPELRQLLSRKVEKLDKSEVKEHGGGVAS